MDYRKTMSRLNAALNNIDAAYEAIAKKYGLTFNALMIFYLIDESENITQKQICDALHLQKSTVHSILLDFTKRGYVTLIEGNNKKEKFIAVTQTGGKHFQKILEETYQMEKNVLDSLGEETCAVLTETAEIVGGLMQKEIARISGNGVAI